VRSISLPHQPGEKVTVLVDLDKSTHEIVKRDSVASIETEGLLGNRYLAISFGSAGKPELRDGDTLASRPPLQMSHLLLKMSGILDTSQQAIRNATGATEHLDSISAKIDGGQGTVGAPVNDSRLYSNLSQTTSALHDTMAHARARRKSPCSRANAPQARSRETPPQSMSPRKRSCRIALPRALS
jgi:phospholipid/cholesterol/gamma-HCH transport system substrate-binding protein